MEHNLGGKRVVTEVMRGLKTQPLVDQRTNAQRARDWIASIGKTDLLLTLTHIKREADRGDVASKEAVKTLGTLLNDGHVGTGDLLGLAWYLREFDK